MVIMGSIFGFIGLFGSAFFIGEAIKSKRFNGITGLWGAVAIISIITLVRLQIS